jgi:hypothetical protein
MSGNCKNILPLSKSSYYAPPTLLLRLWTRSSRAPAHVHREMQGRTAITGDSRYKQAINFAATEHRGDS